MAQIVAGVCAGWTDEERLSSRLPSLHRVSQVGDRRNRRNRRCSCSSSAFRAARQDEVNVPSPSARGFLKRARCHMRHGHLCQKVRIARTGHRPFALARGTQGIATLKPFLQGHDLTTRRPMPWIALPRIVQAGGGELRLHLLKKFAFRRGFPIPCPAHPSRGPQRSSEGDHSCRTRSGDAAEEVTLRGISGTLIFVPFASAEPTEMSVHPCPHVSTSNAAFRPACPISCLAISSRCTCHGPAVCGSI